jgi:hypothetical protein
MGTIRETHDVGEVTKQGNEHTDPAAPLHSKPDRKTCQTKWVGNPRVSVYWPEAQPDYAPAVQSWWVSFLGAELPN